MLRASGRQKYERVCEAEASRKAGVGIDGQRRAAERGPRASPSSSFLLSWTWRKALKC